MRRSHKSIQGSDKSMRGPHESMHRPNEGRAFSPGRLRAPDGWVYSSFGDMNNPNEGDASLSERHARPDAGVSPPYATPDTCTARGANSNEWVDISNAHRETSNGSAYVSGGLRTAWRVQPFSNRPR